jgi:hypothetical protein
MNFLEFVAMHESVRGTSDMPRRLRCQLMGAKPTSHMSALARFFRALGRSIYSDKDGVLIAVVTLS